jgi:alkaline phosphatase D
MINRRQAIRAAAAMGASLAWPNVFARGAQPPWSERRDLYPQGVASGDPHSDSVLLWTRRPPSERGIARRLTLEVARDPEFREVVARGNGFPASENDWTCRVLAAGLEPSRVYWYRFTDEHGFGSRIGRTITAPPESDARPIAFAFVSCQNVTQGANNAYRRMIWEDEQNEKRSAQDRLAFVLHLGDFVYELVWYPEDRPQGMYDRRLRDIVRYPNGERIHDFHVPTTVDDYRALYRGYLTDLDLQDARARWPFVYMWDNHEFSWKCWQSQQDFDGVRPAQTRKVAANQAWFEYQPARVVKAGDSKADRFEPPRVKDTPIHQFDASGLGVEPGNIAAIESLKLFRILRWGRAVELILTDNRTYRSEPVTYRKEAAVFETKDFPYFASQEVIEILDAGRAYAGGRPPRAIRFGGADVPNPRREASSQSMLGAKQKAWFLERLRASTAIWKLWGNSVGTLDWRTDLQNLPAGSGPPWPSASFGVIAVEDWCLYRSERAEILDTIRREAITGVVSLGGDRHCFQAGLLSRSLPPEPFEPVAAEFVTASISAPGLAEAAEHNLPPDHPWRALYVYRTPVEKRMQPALNNSLMHGVRASLALQSTADSRKALAARNPDVAPHLSFIDVGGHGYSVVRADAAELQVEFVCVPRPVESSGRPDGGPIAYRVSHRLALWKPGGSPRMERTRLEGTPPLLLELGSADERKG